MNYIEYVSWWSSKNPDTKSACQTIFDITTVSTVTAPLSTMCDGFPRAQSVAEATTTYIKTVPNTPCLNKDTKTSGYLPDAPTCQVPQLDCADSWARYLDAFGEYGDTYNYNATVTMDITSSKYLGARPCDKDAADGTCENYIIDTSNPFQISGWKNHLFTNCTHVQPRLRAWLIDESHRPELEDLPEQELDRRYDGIHLCGVKVDSLVLFHFPLDIPTTRNICTNSGFGEYFSYVPLYVSTNPAISAVVTAATFGMHDLRSGDASISK
jgi:hypothetical protein